MHPLRREEKPEPRIPGAAAQPEGQSPQAAEAHSSQTAAAAPAPAPRQAPQAAAMRTAPQQGGTPGLVPQGYEEQAAEALLQLSRPPKRTEREGDDTAERPGKRPRAASPAHPPAPGAPSVTMSTPSKADASDTFYLRHLTPREFKNHVADKMRNSGGFVSSVPVTGLTPEERRRQQIVQDQQRQLRSLHGEGQQTVVRVPRRKYVRQVLKQLTEEQRQELQNLLQARNIPATAPQSAAAAPVPEPPAADRREAAHQACLQLEIACNWRSAAQEAKRAWQEASQQAAADWQKVAQLAFFWREASRTALDACRESVRLLDIWQTNLDDKLKRTAQAIKNEWQGFTSLQEADWMEACDKGLEAARRASAP